MLEAATLEIIGTVLKNDPKVTPDDRSKIMLMLRGKSPVVEKERKFYSRNEVAIMLCRTARTVDQLAQEGVLKKVKLPGRNNSCGITAKSVHELMEKLGK